MSEALSQAVDVQLKMMDQITALEGHLRALRRIAWAAQHYAVNYCKDEADDVENCVCGDAQHKAAKELFDALAEWKP